MHKIYFFLISILLLIILSFKFFLEKSEYKTLIIDVSLFNIDNILIFRPDVIEKLIRQKFYEAGYDKVSVKRTFPHKDGNDWWAYYTFKTTSFSEKHNLEDFLNTSITIINESNEYFKDIIVNDLESKKYLNSIIFDVYNNEFINHSKKNLAENLENDTENIFFFIKKFLDEKNFYLILKQSEDLDDLITTMDQFIRSNKDYQLSYENRLNAFIEEHSNGTDHNYDWKNKIIFKESVVLNSYSTQGYQYYNQFIIIFSLFSLILFTAAYAFITRKVN